MNPDDFSKGSCEFDFQCCDKPQEVSLSIAAKHRFSCCETVLFCEFPACEKQEGGRYLPVLLSW